jgi:hypothetical protein
MSSEILFALHGRPLAPLLQRDCSSPSQCSLSWKHAAACGLCTVLNLWAPGDNVLAWVPGGAVVNLTAFLLGLCLPARAYTDSNVHLD